MTPLTAEMRPPYCEYWGDPSYGVCDCCGFEFGNDDEPGTAEPVSFRTFLNEWIAAGMPWFNAGAKPCDWSFEQQTAYSALST